MQLNELLTEDRAVSPVIGVILMVAITVILAAVIGTFVLGLSDQVSNSTPQAQFGFELQDGDANVSISHESGDAIAASELNATTTAPFVVDNTEYDTKSFDNLNSSLNGISGNEMTAGDSVELVRAGSGGGNTWSGETVRVVWSAPDSSDTSTLAQREF